MRARAGEAADQPKPKQPRGQPPTAEPAPAQQQQQPALARTSSRGTLAALCTCTTSPVPAAHPSPKHPPPTTHHRPPRHCWPSRARLHLTGSRARLSPHRARPHTPLSTLPSARRPLSSVLHTSLGRAAAKPCVSLSRAAQQPPTPSTPNANRQHGRRRVMIGTARRTASAPPPLLGPPMRLPLPPHALSPLPCRTTPLPVRVFEPG